MKVKHFVKGSLLAGLVLLPVLSKTVDAAPGDYEPRSANSDATVEFTQPQDTPSIIDPENPGEDNDEQGGTGQTGPLTIDWVSNLNFGSHEFSVEKQTYEATNPAPFVQVSDRRGTSEGWNLTVQAAPFTTSGLLGAETSLPGATLTFTGGEAVSRINPLLAPTVSDPIEVETNNEATQVATATPGQGVGSWAIRWLKEEGLTTDSKVELTVPEAAASTGEHTSTLTWTLTDAPGQ